MVEDEPDDTPLKPGDPVWVKSVAKRGVFLSANSRGEAQISLGKITLKIKKGDYYKVKK